MESQERSGNGLVIILVIALAVLVLTWAVSTLFAMAFAKALSAVIIGVFILGVILIASGLGF